MKNRYFKGFNRLFGRAKKSAARTLKERFDEIPGRAPGQLHSLFSEAVEAEKIAGANGCRERLFPADVTFWGMLGQVFRGGSLRDAVREIQASICAADGERELSNSTGSYSDARQRLPQDSVNAEHGRVCEKMMSSGGFVGGRRVMVVDGTSVPLEDTARNQQEYPQPVGQKPGCGFPVMQIVALLNLDSSALEHFSFSPHTADEGGMFDVELMEHLKAGDVLQGDRLYGSYLHFAALAARGVDVLTRLHGLAWLAQGRAWRRCHSAGEAATAKRPSATSYAGGMGSAAGNDHGALRALRHRHCGLSHPAHHGGHHGALKEILRGRDYSNILGLAHFFKHPKEQLFVRSVQFAPFQFLYDVQPE